MKRSFLIIVLLITMSFALHAKDRIAARTIFLDRVYENPYGFAITYGDLEPYYNEVLLPLSWFGSQHRSFAKVYYIKNDAVPYLLLYYKNGVLSNINLYMPRNPLHPKRHTLNNTRDIRKRFDLKAENAQF